MSTGRRLSKPFLVFWLMALLALTLVACGAEEGQETLEAIPGDDLEETPLFEETPALEETPLVEETPLMEETPEMVEETPEMAEETPVMEETPEPEMEETPLVEETPMTDEGAQDDAPVSGTDTMTMTQWVRSDALLEMTVAGPDGANLGTVSDVLVDTQGNIQYVLIDGQLDQTQTVAVAWDQVEVRNSVEMMGEAGEADDALSETTDEAEDAADAELQDDETPAPAEDETPAAGELVENNNGLVLLYNGADLQAETAVGVAALDEVDALVSLDDLGLEADAAATDSNVIQLSEFDYNLINQNGDDLGEIEGLVIDVQQGAVAYAVADIGGFLELGENTIAVPWAKVQFNETEESFVLNATEESLTNAPTVNLDDWNQGMAPSQDWHTEVDSFWQSVEAETG